MIRHVTRFTEEIFALIIAVVYLYEPFKKLYKVQNKKKTEIELNKNFSFRSFK